jgi:hypothetical protein
VNQDPTANEPDASRPAPNRVRIESNGYGGHTNWAPNTRVTIDDVDVSRYVTDITWTIGISGQLRDGNDALSFADIRYNAVLLNAEVPISPEHEAAIRRVRAWTAGAGIPPSLSCVEAVLAELDQIRAYAAALTHRRWPVPPDARDADTATLRARNADLQHVAAAMLNSFDTKTHPGYSAMRSRHVEMCEIEKWRAVVWPPSPTPPQQEAEAAAPTEESNDV